MFHLSQAEIKHLLYTWRNAVLKCALYKETNIPEKEIFMN